MLTYSFLLLLILTYDAWIFTAKKESVRTLSSKSIFDKRNWQ